MTDELAIDVRGLHKGFGGGTEGAGLNGIDLGVPRGTVCGLLGPNGAGKTTAVRILATLMRPDAGTVRVAGHDVRTQARQVRSRIGLVGQHAAVDEILDGRQNLVMFARLNHLSTRDAHRRADELLADLSLEDTGRQPVSTYSGGMRRRLDLAAGLIVAPDVLLVDEPSTGLDPSGRRDVWAALRRLVDGGTTVLLTTQYLEEADFLADRITMLAAGRVVGEGTPDELKARLGSDWIEVQAADAEDARSIAAIGQQLGEAEVGVDGLWVRIPVADRARAVLELAVRLREADVVPADITVRRPSLDEVFFELTADTGSVSGDEVAA
jgi:ABC-2 type transport system ATP-binding protein